MIDEVSEAGKLPGLGSLIKKGRSKGAAVVLAFQSIEGLRRPESFGVQLSADILGQVGHRFIGKLECPQTALWASQLVGEQQIRRVTVSHTYANEHSVTYNETYVTEPTILPSEFLSLPTCNVENGLTAFYLSRNQKGVILNTLPGADLFHRDLVPLCDRLLGFVPRSPDAQYLRPWTPEEEAVFAPPPPAKGSTGRKKPPAPDMNDLLDGMHDL
ncbi:MAG: type IV secretion system DNA-binding domain-containing protein [Planctomycetaceae bacterium]|nr:type IV secretion system DNA-binding domain-containing protein [Planctomycetaceae bacterium]